MSITKEKETYCHTCQLWFHYLGIASHRKSHLRGREDCRITYTNGDTYTHNWRKTCNRKISQLGS